MLVILTLTATLVEPLFSPRIFVATPSNTSPNAPLPRNMVSLIWSRVKWRKDATSSTVNVAALQRTGHRLKHHHLALLFLQASSSSSYLWCGLRLWTYDHQSLKCRPNGTQGNAVLPLQSVMPIPPLMIVTTLGKGTRPLIDRKEPE